MFFSSFFGVDMINHMISFLRISEIYQLSLTNSETKNIIRIIWKHFLIRDFGMSEINDLKNHHKILYQLLLISKKENKEIFDILNSMLRKKSFNIDSCNHYGN